MVFSESGIRHSLVNDYGRSFLAKSSICLAWQRKSSSLPRGGAWAVAFGLRDRGETRERARRYLTHACQHEVEYRLPSPSADRSVRRDLKGVVASKTTGQPSVS